MALASGRASRLGGIDSVTELGLSGVSGGIGSASSRPLSSLGGSSGAAVVPMMELFARRKPALPTRPQPPAFEQIEEDLASSPADVVFSLQPDCISFQTAPGIAAQQPSPAPPLASAANSSQRQHATANGQGQGPRMGGGATDPGGAGGPGTGAQQGGLGLGDSEGCYQRVRQFIEMNDRVAGFAEASTP